MSDKPGDTVPEGAEVDFSNKMSYSDYLSIACVSSLLEIEKNQC